MYPTAFAEALVPQVRETLRTVEAMLATTSRFDPAATQRTFRLVASDYVVTAVLAPVLQALPRLAPGLRIELVLPSDAAQSDLRDGRADLLIAPEQFILSDHPSELLCEERHVVVGWADNPAFAAGGPIRRFSPPAMFRCGSAPRAIMPLLIANSTRWALSAGGNRSALVQHDPVDADEHAAHGGDAGTPGAPADGSLSTGDGALPFAFQPMREMVQYHRTRTSDEGLRWLMARLREAAYRS
jgi:DNA-binding transcriptional LysR family regulator